MADSDASLVARVVTDDDRAAIELLVWRYQSPLRNFLRRLTRANIERADDLAQSELRTDRRRGSKQSILVNSGNDILTRVFCVPTVLVNQ
jgi:hypothetical protein